MLGIINVTPENAGVYKAAYVYCFVIFIGIAAQMGYNFICGVLRAYGDSVTPLIFLMISTCLLYTSHTLREAEGGVVVIGTAEKGYRNIQHIGVALGVFAVKVAVNYETEVGKVRHLVECVCYGAVDHAPVAVVVSPYLAVNTVYEI